MPEGNKQWDCVIYNMRRILVYMSDCVDETQYYVNKQAVFKEISEFQHIFNLENIRVKIQHFQGF